MEEELPMEVHDPERGTTRLCVSSPLVVAAPSFDGNHSWRRDDENYCSQRTIIGCTNRSDPKGELSSAFLRDEGVHDGQLGGLRNILGGGFLTV